MHYFQRVHRAEYMRHVVAGSFANALVHLAHANHPYHHHKLCASRVARSSLLLRCHAFALTAAAHILDRPPACATPLQLIILHLHQRDQTSVSYFVWYPPTSLLSTLSLASSSGRHECTCVSLCCSHFLHRLQSHRITALVARVSQRRLGRLLHKLYTARVMHQRRRKCIPTLRHVRNRY